MVEGTGNDFIWLMGHFSFGSHKSFSSSARCDKKKLITDPGSRALFPMVAWRGVPGDSFKRWEYVGWLCVTYLSPFMALLHPFPLFSWRSLCAHALTARQCPVEFVLEIATAACAKMTENRLWGAETPRKCNFQTPFWYWIGWWKKGNVLKSVLILHACKIHFLMLYYSIYIVDNVTD